MIKISTLNSSLHEKEAFNKENLDFITSIEKKLGEKLEISDVSDYDCDLKLIFIASGGSEGLFKEAFSKLEAPYYLLTSGNNNSLAASLEILCYINTLGLKGEIIHGDLDYIASTINSLKNKNKSLNILKGKRYGIIGTPSDWLISSIPNKDKLEHKFGCKLFSIPLDYLTMGYHVCSVSNVDPKNYDYSEVESAQKVAKVLKDIRKDNQLDGLTLRCFDLLSLIHTTGCLGLAQLNSQGISSSCEGDIMALISMEIIRHLCNKSSFQANPSRINTKDNTILFAHCTLPLDMCESYTYMSHFESGIGVGIRGKLKQDVVTVFRMSSDLEHFFVSRGHILENLEEEGLCRTQILVKMDEDVSALLKEPCGNHHIIVYGDYAEEIKSLLS